MTEQLIAKVREFGDWNGNTAEFNDVGLQLFVESIITDVMHIVSRDSTDYEIECFAKSFYEDEVFDD